MFLIYQNIIKLSSSIFGLFIFVVSFFLIQLSVSFINITPIEFLIKPLLISKINDYENNFWWPHIDHCKFTAIIYLNYDQDSGTNLYQQIKADPKGEIEHFMPWRPKIRYKLLTTINSGFNRLAIFPGNQLHGMSINNSNYFNSNWRLNQVIFFD